MFVVVARSITNEAPVLSSAPSVLCFPTQSRAVLTVNMHSILHFKSVTFDLELGAYTDEAELKLSNNSSAMVLASHRLFVALRSKS